MLLYDPGLTLKINQTVKATRQKVLATKAKSNITPQLQSAQRAVAPTVQRNPKLKLKLKA